MKESSKEEQEKIILSFKNAIADKYVLHDDLLSISEESIDQISSDIVRKYHCFSTKETTNNFLLQVLSFIRIRPLKISLYGKLLFKVSKYLAPLTSEQELMDLFSSVELIILNLLEANLITINTILKYLKFQHQYIYYFCNEIRKNDPVYFGELVMKYEKLEDFVLSISPEDHDKKRRIGLNDGENETMIRENKIPNIHPNHQVNNSIYENCDFLSNISYAEYAAYFGSINVLKNFLEFKDIKTDRLLYFAIAGGQTDTFNFLLIQKVKKIQITHKCLRASIDFHTTKEIEISYENDKYNTFKKVDNSKKYVKINDLLYALKKSNWHFFIENLLYAKDQINEPCSDDDDDKKSTLLHFACLNGHKEVVKLLLSLFGDKNYFEHDYENDKNFDYTHSSGARVSSFNVNVQDQLKRTPLHLAVSNQKVEIVKILFKCDDTDFQIQDVNGKTVVHYSAETKNIEIVRLFVDSSPNHDIDMNINDSKGNTAFHYFCKPRYFEPLILKIICDSTRVNTNHLNHKKVTEVMHSIIKKNRMKILQTLVDSDRVDLNYQTPEKNETALMIAAQNNNVEAAKILMKNIDRIDPNLQDVKLRTALHIAVHYKASKVFEFLIRQPSVNMNLIDDFELTPVFSALYKRNFKFFESMLESNKEREKNNDQRYIENNINFEHRDHFSQNFLHYALRCKYMTGLDPLLKIYSINEPDSKGTNPFHHVCSLGYIDIIKYLINKLDITNDEEENNTIGLYNSSTDHNGISSIKEKEKKEVDDLKIARYKPGEKIRINQKDSNGLTPFHYACQCNSNETVNYLLSIPGIKINEKDIRGETPFFYACKYGFFEIAKTLFNTDQIDPYSKNFKGVSAMSYLSEKDQKKLL